ncbi:hypothetical protein BD779DRAFT_1470978 [Infundibulicybe gibba]|nr:hypothetical protein BD779DRAFT_1470978 [Infundibulicybe gibba]
MSHLNSAFEIQTLTAYISVSRAATPSPGSDVLANVSLVAGVVASAGDMVPPPAGPILKAVGGSVVAIIGLIQQHFKNQKDAEALLQDIEAALSDIRDEARFLSPVATPRFYEAIQQFHSSLESIEKSIPPPIPPKRRKRDLLKKPFQFLKDAAQVTLTQEYILSRSEEFKKHKNNLQVCYISCVFLSAYGVPGNPPV